LALIGNNLGQKFHSEGNIMEKYTIEIERDGTFFVAHCVEHPNCFTQGRTLKETLRNIQEVLELMLDVKNPKMEAHLVNETVEAIVQVA
jgi:predicted RNase H-like HicB family nuclease